MTFYRLGDRLFSLDQVQEINLEYSPLRHDKLKPPSPDAGVEVILSDGRRLSPFWDSDAVALRDFLAGRPVPMEVMRPAPGLTVIRLLAAWPAAAPPVSPIWGEVEVDPSPAGVP